jgi:hypothetical protein
VVLGTLAEIGGGRPELTGQGLEEIFLSLTGNQDTTSGS